MCPKKTGPEKKPSRTFFGTLPETFQPPPEPPQNLRLAETLCFLLLRKIAHLDRILMFVSLCFHCFPSSRVQGMTNFVVSVFPAPDSPLIRTVLKAHTSWAHANCHSYRNAKQCVSVSENLADFSFYRKFHDRWHLLCWRHASQKSAAICPLMIWIKHVFWVHKSSSWWPLMSQPRYLLLQNNGHLVEFGSFGTNAHCKTLNVLTLIAFWDSPPLIRHITMNWRV